MRLLKKRYINGQIDKILNLFQKQTFESYPIFADELPDFLKPIEDTVNEVQEEVTTVTVTDAPVRRVIMPIPKKPHKKYGRR